MIHFLKVTFHLLTNECRYHFPFGPTLIRVLVIRYTAKTSSGIVSNHVTVHFEIGFFQNCEVMHEDGYCLISEGCRGVEDREPKC